jgi:alpha-aminoadipate carrier protein LysW
MINCPKCDAVIDVEEDELDEGEPLICEECGTHLIVTGIDPLELEIDDEGSGYDDEDDDFDEDEDEDDDFDEEDEEDQDDEDEDWR